MKFKKKKNPICIQISVFIFRILKKQPFLSEHSSTLYVHQTSYLHKINTKYNVRYFFSCEEKPIIVFLILSTYCNKLCYILNNNVKILLV